MPLASPTPYGFGLALRAAFASLAALAAACATAAAADLYVSPTAPAFFGGDGSSNAPFGMIQAGIHAAWTNDADTTIHVAPGVYQGARIGGEGGSYPGGIGWDGVGMLFMDQTQDYWNESNRGSGRITVRGGGLYPSNTVISSAASTVPRATGYYNSGFIRGNPRACNNLTFANLTFDLTVEKWGYGLCGQAPSRFADTATPFTFERCDLRFGPDRGVISGNDGPGAAGNVVFRHTQLFLGHADNRILFQWAATTAEPAFADGSGNSLIWNTAGRLVTETTLLLLERGDKNGNTVTASAPNTNGAFTNFNVTAPRLAVFGLEGREIPAGDISPAPEDGTDFGTAHWQESSRTRTFVVANYGAATLALTGTPAVVISGGGFFVVTPPSQTGLATGASTEFSLGYRAVGSSDNTAAVTIASDDPAVPAYTFSVRAATTGSPGMSLMVR